MKFINSLKAQDTFALLKSTDAVYKLLALREDLT